MRKLFILLVVVLLPSCAMSKNPLSDPDKARLDQRLLGVWDAVDSGEQKVRKGEYAFLFAGKSGLRRAPAGLMEVFSVGHDAGSRVQVQGPLFLFATSLDGKSYLNVIEIVNYFPDADKGWDKSKIPGYLFARYIIQDNDLEVWFMNDDVLKAAVKKGVLKGTVQEKGILTPERITVTASSEELCQFIASASEDDLFPAKDRMRYKRVK